MNSYVEAEKKTRENIQKWRVTSQTPIPFHAEASGGFRNIPAETLFVALARVSSTRPGAAGLHFAKVASGALARDTLHRHRSGSFFLRYAYPSSRYQSAIVAEAAEQLALKGVAV